MGSSLEISWNTPVKQGISGWSFFVFQMLYGSKVHIYQFNSMVNTRKNNVKKVSFKVYFFTEWVLMSINNCFL